MDTPATKSADTHDAAPAPSPAGPPDDVMIHCMSCDYNVTYTPEDRCPECGQLFDRAALVEWTTGRDQPLPFGRTQPHKFRSIFLASLFTPSKLGRQLPPYPDLGEAFLYSLEVKAITAGFVVSSLSFVPGSHNREKQIFILVAISLGCFLCEVLLSAAFRLLVKTRCGNPDEDPMFFWLAFSSCFAGYAAIVAVVIVVGNLILELEYFINSILGSHEVIVYGTIFIMPFIIALWWWSSLSRALHARCESSWRATVAALLVPIVAFVSTCATVITTALLIG